MDNMSSGFIKGNTKNEELTCVKIENGLLQNNSKLHL